MTYRHLGSFRLLLAVLVMCQHYFANLGPESLGVQLAPYPGGSIAVVCFFALSGFVITEAIDRVYINRPTAFLGNRLLRIVPHFIIAVALVIAAYALFEATGGGQLFRTAPAVPDYAFRPVNLVLNFIGIAPLADHVISYNFLEIAWAVRVEVVFYLISAACIVLASRSGLRYATVCMWAAVAISPLYLLTMVGRGVAMFSFLPYFVYGGAVYFALKGSRGALLVAALCVPAMLVQCATLATTTSGFGTFPSVVWSVSLLVILLTLMTALACCKFRRGRAVDRAIGDLTYPLYLYHEVVLVFALTLFGAGSYVVLFGSMLVSLLVAALMARTVDPILARYRDRIRGVKLAANSSASAWSPKLRAGYTERV